jgi:hypothetical protein
MKYYLYYHRNPINNNVFYIGIGRLKRAWNFRDRNIHWKRYTKKYGLPIVELINNNLTKEEASVLEKKLILEYGRKGYELNGMLTNISLGGEGTCGYKWDEDRKFNHSEIMSEWFSNHKEEWILKHNLGILNRKIDYTNIKNGPKGIPIIQKDKNNQTIKIWPSAKTIKNQLGISIDSVLSGKSKTAGGFKWEYEEKINRN